MSLHIDFRSHIRIRSGTPKLALFFLLHLCLYLFEFSIPTTEAQQPVSINTCVTCHADLEDKKMSTPVSEWERSVHRPADISCQDCHGGNSNTSSKENAHDISKGFVGLPEPEVVHETCGTCHQSQKDNYLPSPHGIEGDFWPNCVDCHSNHEVIYSDASLISIPDNCEDCHEQETMDDFIALTNRGLEPLKSFQKAAAEIRLSGVPVDMILAQTILARETYIQNASHVFVFEKMIATVDSLERVYPQIQKAVDSAQTEVDTRLRFGWVFVCLFLLIAGVIWLYRRHLPSP